MSVNHINKWESNELDTALRHAFKEFKYRHPIWVKGQFNEDFLLNDAAQLWERYSRLQQLPTAVQLAKLWSDRLGNASLKCTIQRTWAAIPIASDFLRILKSELAAPKRAVFVTELA